MSNLLTDVYSYGELSLLNEGKGGPLKVRGRFQMADEKNQNGRIYERKLLEREVTKLQKTINERRLVGELDHPKDEVVHLTNVSHVITGLHMEGNEVIGEAEILNTPSGQVLSELLKAGVKVGISSRGVGGLSYDQKRGGYKVDENLKLITWDMVSDPSCHDAFPSLMEGKQAVLSEEAKHVAENVDHLRAEKIFIQALKNELKK